MPNLYCALFGHTRTALCARCGRADRATLERLLADNAAQRVRIAKLRRELIRSATARIELLADLERVRTERDDLRAITEPLRVRGEAQA